MQLPALRIALPVEGGADHRQCRQQLAQPAAIGQFGSGQRVQGSGTAQRLQSPVPPIAPQLHKAYPAGGRFERHRPVGPLQGVAAYIESGVPGSRVGVVATPFHHRLQALSQFCGELQRCIQSPRALVVPQAETQIVENQWGGGAHLQMPLREYRIQRRNVEQPGQLLQPGRQIAGCSGVALLHQTYAFQTDMPQYPAAVQQGVEQIQASPSLAQLDLYSAAAGLFDAQTFQAQRRRPAPPTDLHGLDLHRRADGFAQQSRYLVLIGRQASRQHPPDKQRQRRQQQRQQDQAQRPAAAMIGGGQNDFHLDNHSTRAWVAGARLQDLAIVTSTRHRTVPWSTAPRPGT